MEDITRKRLLSSQRTGNELLVLPTNSDRLKVLGLVDNREMYKVMCQGNKSSIFDNDVFFPGILRKDQLFMPFSCTGQKVES